MKYAYEDLSYAQFEKLIVLLCHRLLGISVQGFADGPDGGRDAKFLGTAELHPSSASPWVGTTIIQAKHTNGLNRHFAESGFYSPDAKDAVLSKEIHRINNLRSSNQLDHYMLFANRRLAGNAESEIRTYISEQCSIPLESIYLCGLEQLELWLKTFPDVATLANLDPVDSPLIVNSEDLAVVVQALARNKDKMSVVIDDPPASRVSYKQKNAINNMTADYARELRKKYLEEASKIRAFLAAPENLELLRLYESVIDEFQLKIIANRSDHQTFDKVMEYLVDLLFGRDPILRKHGHKRLTRALLFYMYWNCDIGRKVGDA